MSEEGREGGTGGGHREEGRRNIYVRADKGRNVRMDQYRDKNIDSLRLSADCLDEVIDEHSNHLYIGRV